MPHLTCQEVDLGYDGRTIVSKLSFAVDPGDYLCIVGENGSGKTTLMRTILRLLPPLAGRIEMGGGLMQNEVGYLPQQTVVQRDFPASVREVVRSGCLNRCGLRPYYTPAEKQMAEDNMERLGVAHLARRSYRELSGGQQQKALLARALCATRKILLLDEPVSGLDPKAAGEMYELIASLNGSGTSIIMISHDISASLKYASHILHIAGQSSYFYGTRDEYLNSDIGRLYAAIGGAGI